MEAKRISEWLSTADSLLKIAVTVFASLVALLTAVSGQLKPLLQALGLPAFVQPTLLGFILAAVSLFFWFDFRRFNRQSRLEQPDKFSLVATTPETLLGRGDDLASLCRAVAQHRIVLLDGESGCGKSALVAAGLVSTLRATDGLLPVLVRDWGDDWIRGPLAATLDALYAALTSDQRARLDWTSSPDLAAPTNALAGALAPASPLSPRPSAVARC